MIEGKPTVDQRKSYRIPVAPENQFAQLRFRDQSIPTRLFNESAGGFGGVVCEKGNLKAEEIVELETVSGRYRARVAYIEPLRLSSDDPSKIDGYRIGFERLDEVAVAPTSSPAGTALHSASKPASSWAALILLTVTVVTAAAVGIHWGFNARWETTVKAEAEVAPPPTSSPAFLTVMRQVGLNKRQQEQLARTADQTVKLLQEIDALWKNDSPEERRIKQALLIEAANQEILRMLTEEQRARWLELVYTR